MFQQLKKIIITLQPYHVTQKKPALCTSSKNYKNFHFVCVRVSAMRMNSDEIIVAVYAFDICCGF